VDGSPEASSFLTRTALNLDAADVREWQVAEVDATAQSGVEGDAVKIDFHLFAG
jgi:hypothetical protein